MGFIALRTMNPDDYDDDGNNIVPCPICLSVYCLSKEGGECPEEDDFIKAVSEESKITKKQNDYLVKAIAKSAPNIPEGYQEQYLRDEL